ncbi:MAG: hypothetical protein JWM80_2335 [Cyanobacteria bacterium RYN_339]|nr:hypothetical protein [Cyanobacteria bacterium RYN_339]
MTPRRAGLLAVAGLLAGLAVAYGLTQLATEPNYGHQDFMGGIVQLMLMAVAWGWLGAYAAIAIPWVRGAAVSPGLIATSAAVGSNLGLASTGLLGFPPLQWAAGLAGAYGGAWVAARWSPPAWSAAWARAAQAALVALIVLVGTLAIVRPASDFPGNAAPTAVRHAWAQATFGDRYAAVEAYLRGNAAVRQHLGKVLGVAPVEGPNRTATTPGEVMGTFTVQVQGDRASAVAHVELLHMGGTDQIHGTLDVPGGPVNLQP